MDQKRSLARRAAAAGRCRWAVLVRDGKKIGEGWNHRPIGGCESTAHAEEVLTLRAAANEPGNYRLADEHAVRDAGTPVRCVLALPCMRGGAGGVRRPIHVPARRVRYSICCNRPGSNHRCVVKVRARRGMRAILRNSFVLAGSSSATGEDSTLNVD